MTSVSSPHEFPFSRLRQFSIQLAPPEQHKWEKKGSQHRKPDGHCCLSPCPRFQKWPLVNQSWTWEAKNVYYFGKPLYHLDSCKKCSGLRENIPNDSIWNGCKLHCKNFLNEITWKEEWLEVRTRFSDLHSPLDSGHFTYPLFISTSSSAK